MIRYFHFIGACGSDRYFKVDVTENNVVQVVLNGGKIKKGRPHCFGIYRLAMSTFTANYLYYLGRRPSGNRLLITTENQYKKALIKLIQEI